MSESVKFLVGVVIGWALTQIVWVWIAANERRKV